MCAIINCAGNEDNDWYDDGLHAERGKTSNQNYQEEGDTRMYHEQDYKEKRRKKIKQDQKYSGDRMKVRKKDRPRNKNVRYYDYEGDY